MIDLFRKRRLFWLIAWLVLLTACNLPLDASEAPVLTPEPILPTAGEPPTPFAPVTNTPTLLPTPVLPTATVTSPLTATLAVTDTLPLTATIPAPSPTAPPPPPAETPEGIDPCLLLTREEAVAVLGEAVREPVYDGLTCAYSDDETQLRLVSILAAQGEQRKNLLTVRFFQLEAYGLSLDQTVKDELTALDQAGSSKEILSRLIDLSAGNPNFSAKSVAEMGDIAFWAWKDTGHGVRQGFLIAQRGDTLVGADLVLSDKAEEDQALDLAMLIVRQAFTRLPGQFTIITPTPGP